MGPIFIISHCLSLSQLKIDSLGHNYPSHSKHPMHCLVERYQSPWAHWSLWVFSAALIHRYKEIWIFLGMCFALLTVFVTWLATRLHTLICFDIYVAALVLHNHFKKNLKLCFVLPICSYFNAINTFFKFTVSYYLEHRMFNLYK